MADPINVNSIPTDSPISTPIVRRMVTHAAERHWIFRKFVGTGEFSQIYQQEEIGTGGDTVRILFSPTREQGGFPPGGLIEGNEASVDLHYDEMKINGWSFAWTINDPMAQQRAPVSLKKLTLTKAPIQWQRHWERNFCYQLSGFTPVNTAAGLNNVRSLLKLAADATVDRNNLSGMNSVAAIDANHEYFTGDLADAPAVGGSTEAIAGMKFKWIDDLLEKATSSVHLDYPILPGPDGFYDLVMHPVAATQLKNDTTDRNWYDIQRARLEGGGDWVKSAIYANYIGVYERVRFWTSDYLPPAPDAAGTSYEAGTRSFLFLGAKAGCISYGSGFGSGNHLDYKEQIRNYDTWGARVLSLYGMKRTVFPNLAGTPETYGLIRGVHFDTNVV